VITYRYQKLTACVEHAIPTDREFTMVDLMTALLALDDSRRWSKPAVHKHLATLRQKGLIRRLKKGRRGEPAVFVRTGVAVQKRPFEDMLLSEVLVKLLSDRPMNATELTVAVLESGYATAQNRKKLRMTIGNKLRQEAERFIRQGDKWMTN
jgi:DNA-binding transcriptional ArsR family regulator